MFVNQKELTWVFEGSCSAPSTSLKTDLLSFLDRQMKRKAVAEETDPSLSLLMNSGSL